MKYTVLTIISFIYIHYIPAQTSAQGEHTGQIIRVLSLGNSFSDDAIDYYFHDLAKAGGYPLIVGNLVIGGCSLEKHLYNALNNIPAYEYRKVDIEGKRTNKKEEFIKAVLQEEEWDYISFQEVSFLSGVASSYLASLPQLMNYVRKNSKNKDVRFMYHQTWAYAHNATRAGFENYDNDQIKMYNAIVNTAGSVTATLGIEIMIPSGTAIQNGRTSSIGDNFCRDGYHLDFCIGRFTAACTWYEKIFNSDVTGNPYKPECLTDAQSRIAKEAASQAVLHPAQITDLSGY